MSRWGPRGARCFGPVCRRRGGGGLDRVLRPPQMCVAQLLILPLWLPCLAAASSLLCCSSGKKKAAPSSQMLAWRFRLIRNPVPSEKIGEICINVSTLPASPMSILCIIRPWYYRFLHTVDVKLCDDPCILQLCLQMKTDLEGPPWVTFFVYFILITTFLVEVISEENSTPYSTLKGEGGHCKSIQCCSEWWNNTLSSSVSHLCAQPDY